MKKKMKRPNESHNRFLKCEMISLLTCSIGFLGTSFTLEGWSQSLFISLGTGLLSSAVVSFTFWLIQHEYEERKANKNRAELMCDFKMLAYNMINHFDMANCKSEQLSLQDFIKLHHSWFHEYYKRMIANNYNESDTQIRIKQIKEFIILFSNDFNSIFNSRISIGDCKFTDWEAYELKTFHMEFTNSMYYIKIENYKRLFLSFASLLETFMRITTEDNFTELKNFPLLQFQYDDTGGLHILDEEFNEKETLFKFAKEFHAIRENNYRKYYGKASEIIRGDGNNG